MLPTVLRRWSWCYSYFVWLCGFTLLFVIDFFQSWLALWPWESWSIWAATWQNQQSGMCAQRRLRSAWASAVWSESSLCAQWVAKDPSLLHAECKDSDQTGRMPRLIWVFAGRTYHFVGFVMRRLICFLCICLFILHAFFSIFFFFFSLRPHGVRGWLWISIVVLPGHFY